jgi:hypothetical protein
MAEVPLLPTAEPAEGAQRAEASLVLQAY